MKVTLLVLFALFGGANAGVIGTLTWATAGLLPGATVTTSNYVHLNLETAASSSIDAKTVEFYLDPTVFDTSELTNAAANFEIYHDANACNTTPTKITANTANALWTTNLYVDASAGKITVKVNDGATTLLDAVGCHGLRIVDKLKIKADKGVEACAAGKIKVHGSNTAASGSATQAADAANAEAATLVAAGTATGNGGAFCTLCTNTDGTTAITKNTGCFCSNATATGAATSAYCFNATTDQKCTRTGKGADTSVADALDTFACADNTSSSSSGTSSVSVALAAVFTTFFVRRMF